MSVKISITGLKEIDDVLKGMPTVFQDRVLKTAHADAAKPLVDAAKGLVRVGKTSNLKNSIGVERVSMKKVDAVGLVQVGPRRKGGHKGYHGHLIEYGHFTRDGVNKTDAYPFMAPAFEQTKALVEGRIAQSVGVKLAQYIKRTVKK